MVMFRCLVEIRTETALFTPVKPANPSKLHQTQANSVVQSYLTEDGTVWLFRYD